MSGQAPAGWFPDPEDETRNRYWDGQQWTDQRSPRSQQGAPPPPSGQPIAASEGTPPAKKKRRIFLWFFLAVQVIFIIWIIAGASTGAGTPDDCSGLDKETCNAASDIGTGIGVALVVVLWLVVDFLLAVIYGIYRLAKRN